MLNFPLLKTGAAMQYPAELSVRYATQVLQYVDGSEQRYRDSGTPQRQWIVRLDLLDEQELSAIEHLFVAAQGMIGSFAFTDPYDGVEYTDCSFALPQIESRYVDELRGQARVIIRQNRSQ